MSNGLRNQHKHVVRLKTTLDDDSLIVNHCTIKHTMSEGFRLALSVSSDYLHDLQPQELIGTALTVTLMDDDNEPRYFHGWITQLEKDNPADTGDYTGYQLTADSFLCFLEHDSDCRIFQERTVGDVIQEVMYKYKDLGCPYKLIFSKEHPIKRYWVQYEESTLDFFNRICSESGLAYYFTHSENQHCLHITDHPYLLPELEPSVLYYQPGTHARDHITEWQRSSQYFTGNFTQTTYNYKTPRSKLNQSLKPKEHLSKTPRTYLTEKYHYSEQYDTYEGASKNTQYHLDRTTQENTIVIGGGDCRFLKMGYQFTVEPVPAGRYFPDRKKRFALSKVTMSIDNQGSIRVDFEAIPNGEMIYPANNKPKIYSLQTAEVTGPPGEEIYTDKLGRIKVQFHWDRLGKKDANTTCWMRVMQSFSGPEFGGHFTPRIGQEVVVAFENGNPDRPFILGGLHHNAHIPPFHHDRGLRAGIRTQSSKGGATRDCNEVSFYDRTGSEEMFFHAQKDHNSKILYNRAQRVDNHEIESVGGNRSAEVEGNQQEKIGGSMNLSVGGGSGASVLGMIAGVMAAGSSDAQKGAGSVGNSLLSQFVGALASASALAETLSIPANNSFNKAGNHVTRGGKDQSLTADELGELLSKIMPISGVLNTVVEKFKSDTIGIARTEQIGAYKNTTVGHTQTTNVGHTQVNKIGHTQESYIGTYKQTVVGEEYVIEVGKAKLVMKSDGTIIMNGVDISLFATGQQEHVAKGDVIIKGKNVKNNG